MKYLKKIALPVVVLLYSSQLFAAGTAAGTAIADSSMQTADWTGMYIGAGLSFSSGSHTAVGSAYTPPQTDGVLASALVGYNMQSDNIVYGAEILMNFGDIKDIDAGGCGVGASGCISTIQKYAALRARLGYAFDDTLVFATLGYATDRQDQRAFGIGAQWDSKRHEGFTVGIGVEQKIDDMWSVRGDLEYYDLGTETYDNFLGGTDFDASTTAARITMVRKF